MGFDQKGIIAGEVSCILTFRELALRPSRLDNLNEYVYWEGLCMCGRHTSYAMLSSGIPWNMPRVTCIFRIHTSLYSAKKRCKIVVFNCEHHRNNCEVDNFKANRVLQGTSWINPYTGGLFCHTYTGKGGGGGEHLGNIILYVKTMS